MTALSALLALAAGLGAAAVPCAAEPAAAEPARDTPPALETPTVRLDVPDRFVEGRPFPVRLRVDVPAGGAPFAAWLLSPAAFSVDGVAVAPRSGDAALQLPAGARLTVEYDLEPHLAGSKAYTHHDFALDYAEGVIDVEPVAVTCYAPVPPDTDFMELDDAVLAGHQVLLVTEAGEMQAELWPQVAPRTVRNFLDLVHVGFYDGTTFYRVKPGFMIQGGDPTGTGSGTGPRTVPAEFSDRKHVRGVLSMARGTDPDSASCQFFVVHAATPGLDGQYSAFGKLLHGYEALDRIANAPGRPRTDSTILPTQPPRIERALVVRPLGDGH